MTIDANSATWRAVKAWAEQEIENARGRLETRALPIEDTDYERGAIGKLRDLLALTNTKHLNDSADAE